MTGSLVTAAVVLGPAPTRAAGVPHRIFYRVVDASGGYYANADTTWRYVGSDWDNCHSSSYSHGTWTWAHHKGDGVDLDLRGRHYERLNARTNASASSSGSNDCGRTAGRNGAIRTTFQCHHRLRIPRVRGGGVRVVGRKLLIVWDFFAVPALVEWCGIGGGETLGYSNGLLAYDTNKMATTVPFPDPLGDAPVTITVKRPIHDVYDKPTDAMNPFHQTVDGQGSLTITLVRGNLIGGATHGCDSAPGRLVRRATVTATGPQHCALANHTQTTLRYASCADFEVALAANPELAKATWNLYGSWSGVPRRHGFDATEIWTLDPNGTSIDMPKVTWPNMSTTERAALNQALAALSGHEHGHIKIARDFARGLKKAHFHIAGKADGDKQSRARTDEQLAALGKLENLYDTVTEHGKHQSAGPSRGFPGGPDTTFTCPH